MYTADDAKSISEIFKVMEEFGKCSGFKINYDKTTLYQTKSSKKSQVMNYVQQVNIKTTDEINVLGVLVCKQKEQLVHGNFKPLIQKAEAMLKQWSNQSNYRASIFAKVTIYCKCSCRLIICL